MFALQIRYTTLSTPVGILTAIIPKWESSSIRELHTILAFFSGEILCAEKTLVLVDRRHWGEVGIFGAVAATGLPERILGISGNFMNKCLTNHRDCDILG